MRKGTLVKLCEDPTRAHSSMPRVYRHTTRDELESWYNSDASKGIDCAGETKLPPQVVSIAYNEDDTWTIVRSRCAPTIGWHKQPKSAQIMNNRTNETGYVKRVNLTLV
jgi:hypothetical protein